MSARDEILAAVREAVRDAPRGQPPAPQPTVPPVDRAAMPHAGALRGEDPEPLLTRAVGRDGISRWVVHRAQRVLDEDGQLELVVGVVEDITAIKRQEAAQRLLMCEECRVKDVFAALAADPAAQLKI